MRNGKLLISNDLSFGRWFALAIGMTSNSHKLTMKAAKAELTLIGIRLTKRDGEYRVIVAGMPEPHAYYTTDLRDAVQTGAIMAQPISV